MLIIQTHKSTVRRSRVPIPFRAFNTRPAKVQPSQSPIGLDGIVIKHFSSVPLIAPSVLNVLVNESPYLSTALLCSADREGLKKGRIEYALVLRLWGAMSNFRSNRSRPVNLMVVLVAGAVCTCPCKTILPSDGLVSHDRAFPLGDGEIRP